MLILLLTQSRSSWLAFGMAASLLIILRFRWGWLLVLFGGIGILGGIYYFLDYAWLLRWLRSSYLIGDLASRIELWARGLFIIQDFFFTGIGMGTFAQITNAFYPLRGAAPPHVHNVFLQIGVDLGMPGLLAWLAILMVAIWCAWSLYRQSELEGTWIRALGAGLLSSQLALVLHGLFDSVTWGMVRPAPLIWGLWGLCLGAYLLVNRQFTRDA